MFDSYFSPIYGGDIIIWITLLITWTHTHTHAGTHIHNISQTLNCQLCVHIFFSWPYGNDYFVFKCNVINEMCQYLSTCEEI